MAEAIRADRPDAVIGFVGGVEGFEGPLLDEAGVRFDYRDAVHAGPLHGVSPGVAVRSVLALARGTVQALALLRRKRPHAILLTGGWVGLPIALAGRVLGIPSLIYLPDIEPGLTIRLLHPLSARIAATAPESAVYFPARKFVATGYPLRAQMREAASAGRAAACAVFALDPAARVLLVFGGSRGARALNTAVVSGLPALMRAGVQVLHVTGTLDWAEHGAAIERLKAEHGAALFAGYRPFAYLHDAMGAAMAAADLAICRSGASVLGELPLFGLPSVLVPYPFAWRYQRVNADWLAERGAAVVLENDLLERDLVKTALAILGDGARHSAMAAAARALAQPDGAQRAGAELLRLGEKHT